MKKLKIILICIVAFAATAKSENMFKPYTANPFEGRVGTMYPDGR